MAHCGNQCEIKGGRAQKCGDGVVSDERRGLVRARLRPPRLRADVRPRERVGAMIRDLLASRRVLLVTATAGSGKTTAVAQALASVERPMSWLRLDVSDRAAGRLLVYLEAALRAADPSIAPAVEAAFAADVGHVEAAAILAEGVGHRELVIVLDEMEKIVASANARAVLSSFIRHLPDSATVVAISRVETQLSLAQSELAGMVGRIAERDLAFTVNEARAALASLSRREVDAEAAVAATGGWAAGILFGSWTSEQHVHGTGGEVDPLHSYLSTEIMAAMSQRLQEFLTATAILEEVTPARAARLGFGEGGTLLAELAGMHLPVELDRQQLSMRAHPRFRDYLLSRFLELEHFVQQTLRHAHGELLLHEGQGEDAVDEFILAGDIAQAEDVAKSVILDVTRRLDLDVADRWLRSFRRWRIEESPVLTAAEMLVAVDREEYGAGARAADRLLLLSPGTGEGAPIDSRMIGVMAWSYFLVGRIDDARQLLSTAPSDARIDVIRFCIGVELVDDPTHYRDRPLDSGTEIDGLLARVDLAHGRFERLVRGSPSAMTAVRLSRLGALTGLGRLEDALGLAAESTHGWTGTRLQAELLAECRRPEDAWAVLIAGRDRLARTDAPLFRIFALLTEAMLALRFQKDPAQAAAALTAAEREPTALQRVRVVEQLELWRGLIALQENRDAVAVERLRAAVRLMTAWDRRLFLPTAAVYLSEAEWRVGNETKADKAADLALAVSRQIGSMHLIGRAVAEFPAVLSRRLDAEVDADGPWHDLGRSLLLQAEMRSDVPDRSLIRVREVAPAGLEIGGRYHELKLLKAVELLSYLAVNGGSASRSALIGALFESKNDKAAQAYLRMAVNAVRTLFPNVACIDVGPERVTWAFGELSSDLVETQTAYRRLRDVSGPLRLQLARRLLSAVGTGEFLPGARSLWAVEQREVWHGLLLDIRFAASEAAFAENQLGVAHILVREVLEIDRYRERAWRLAMKIAAAVGDGDRVLALFRDCERALAEVPAQPSESTRRLLRDLRN
ncbi:hypothetical protein ABZ896_08165 [Streptomyces sp. NPDC047072]|uniref:hypothetical protein n=1 Tax=Streptomyces sp. NPDC047072 TaxID=3154809 RepID=UPI0033D795E5